MNSPIDCSNNKTTPLRRLTMTQEVPEPIQKCANCGAELRPNDRYCGECGLPAFVPASAEAPKGEPVSLATAAASREPASAPATLPPAQKSDNRTWAVVTGVILLLIGAASCALGSLVMISASWFVSGTDVDPGWLVSGTGLCCVLPAVLLMIAGGAVWYVWGRKKA
jgi:ribosomal protein L32